MTCLITGKNGQLARAFIEQFERSGLPYSAPDESSLNITNIDNIDAIFRSVKPSAIINCAAYNQVDRAEQDRDAAFAVNATGAFNLARAAEDHGAALVHFGSDYVFDGTKEDGLYSENDPVNPLNEYGRSKLEGEQRVTTTTNRALILRLSWVFGAGSQNFIHKLSEWSKNSAVLKIACDEFSVPTYTRMIVTVTLKALEQGLTGTFHLPNTGYCSRYEWAKFILQSRNIARFIRPVSMDSFALPAKRPKFSAMSNQTISKTLNVTIPTWEEDVRAFLRTGNA